MGYSIGCTVILLCAVWLTQTDAVFDVWLAPTQLQYGLTESFYVNCSFERGPSSTMIKPLVLTIQRKTLFDQDFKNLATIDDSAGGHVTVVTTDDVKTAAVINENDVSFLSLTWRFPIELQAGAYRCQARGLDSSNGLVVLEKEVSVTGTFPATDLLVNKIVELDTAARQREDALYYEIERLERRLSITKNVLFAEAFTFNTKTYYLSRVHFSTEDEAIAACSVFRGYLAELNNADEHLALTRHLQETLGSSLGGAIDAVVVGGSDEMRENQWVFQYSGRPVTYSDWAPGEPNDGNLYNCLALWRMSNFKYTDFPCTNANYRALFVCETI
ncbi:uncharacterized protein LOC106073445 [Biomphalaria glabrata]|uniref:Uncharacterized protein LOC106073445 n=1 Tax=Biomphalaria glabrata TaxID=6526 RepID=A0A9U8EIW2_BIOGL|nr:uncharacterized protein LOC106073445 [Biomphalaria glabrata]